MTVTESRPSLWLRARRLLFQHHVSPPRLAVAVALGVFIGLTPFYLLHTVIAAGLAWALRLNIAAAALGTQISNPFFAPGLIAASLWVGNALGQGNASEGAWDPSRGAFYVSWLRGGIVLGLALGIATGLLTYVAATLLRRRRSHA